MAFLLRLLQTRIRGSHIFESIVLELTDRLDSVFLQSASLEGVYLVSKHADCGMEVPCHQDAALDTYRLQKTERRITAWIALQDTSAENGGLLVYPGSHSRGLMKHRNVLRKKGLNQRCIDEGDLIDFDAPRPITVCAGDLVLLHSHAIHGSPRFIHPTSRHALVVDFVY